MPEQDQNQDIPSNRLTDVLGLLGAGGLAKGAAAAAKTAPYLGSFFTPAQFKRLEAISGQQPVHPATWEYLSKTNKARLGGSPTTPDALAHQRFVDKMIMQNAESYKDYPMDKPDLFNRSGWSISPVTGSLVREVQDTGAYLDPKKFNFRANLVHPTADLHQLYNVPPITLNRSWSSRKGEYNPNDRSIAIGRRAPPDIALHEFGHAGHDDAGVPMEIEPDVWGTIPNWHNYYNDPYKWTPRDLEIFAKHTAPISLPSTIKDEMFDAFNKDNFDYLRGNSAHLTYLKSADEVQNRNVENRFKNPELYLQNPHSTQDWPSNELIIDHLKNP